jgi:hypothetical protein
MSDTDLDLPAQDKRRQRQAIAWGSGAFLGIGIGGAIGFSLGDYLLGFGIGGAIMLATAVIYLMSGYAVAERRAIDIVSREEQRDDEDEGGYEDP